MALFGGPVFAKLDRASEMMKVAFTKRAGVAAATRVRGTGRF